ncbi:MAG: hypothetical protein KGO05_13175 [Chloroflexota bacterium]|nr:hypothetical protein [Chloroflexota bacterium]
MADESGGKPDMSDGAANHVGRANTASMAHNVASVADIPWEALPDSAARGCLLEMAYKGADVCAFRAADGGWYVRIEGRIETCAAWAARFSA